MARAMLYADATIVLPMDFLRVPLTAAAGWLIYGERLDVFTVLGAMLILTGNLLNLKSPAPPACAEPERADRSRLTGGYFPAALRKASLIRSCQPGPPSRKCSSTSWSIRSDTSSFTPGIAIRLRRRFRLFLCHFLECGLCFGTGIVQGSRSPRLIRHS